MHEQPNKHLRPGWRVIDGNSGDTASGARLRVVGKADGELVRVRPDKKRAAVDNPIGEHRQERKKQHMYWDYKPGFKQDLVELIVFQLHALRKIVHLLRRIWQKCRSHLSGREVERARENPFTRRKRNRSPQGSRHE